MSLIVPADFRAPLIIPGRRHRKVHWNRERSKAIAALGKYEREDWHRGLTWPQGLFGLAEKYFAKKNNPGCTCCGAECAPCNTIPDEFEVIFGTILNGTCTDCATAFSGQTFICAFTGNFSGICDWGLNIGNTGVCAGVFDTIVGVRTFSPDSLSAGISNSGTTLDLKWLGATGTDDCASISGLSLAFDSDTHHCDASGATCTVTAL